MKERLIKSEQNGKYINDIQEFYKNLLSDESEINFKKGECEDSLIIDIEHGRCQKQERFDFYDDANSVNMSMLEGNYGECLSDCTFILEENGGFNGSKMQSNIMDKGQYL